MINEILKKFQSAITELLAKAELRASDIQLVIRTGGSSLIPAVKKILDVEFAGKVIEHDPFTSVAVGLAIADYKKLGYAQFTENPSALVDQSWIRLNYALKRIVNITFVNGFRTMNII